MDTAALVYRMPIQIPSGGAQFAFSITSATAPAMATRRFPSGNEPIEARKQTLAGLLKGARFGIALNEHFNEPGELVYRMACGLGCEGIVSKRLGSRYVSGRTREWVKIKNPETPAVLREATEEWR
jgi:hypothetical protein